VEDYFTPYFPKLAVRNDLSITEAKKSFQDHYLGYRFTEKEIQVYNPFAAARVLDHGAFDNHWFNSGSPGLLFSFIERENFKITDFENLIVEKSKLNPANIRELTLIPLSYQTGYLTIAEFVDNDLVKLDFPNYEVESYFSLNLLDFLAEDKINRVDVYYLRDSLVKNDEQQFRKYLNSIIDDLKKVEINQSESVKEFYQQLFYLIGKSLSNLYLKITSEILKTEDTVELKIETENKQFMLSFNYGANPEIINQLQEKYEVEKDCTYISVSFDPEKREIAELEIRS